MGRFGRPHSGAPSLMLEQTPGETWSPALARGLASGGRRREDDVAAMQSVRRETTTTTWFRKITADLHRVTTTGACEARYLRGQKAVILAALEQLDRETILPHASLSQLATSACAGRLFALLASTHSCRQAVEELRPGFDRLLPSRRKVVPLHRAA